ncbi:iron(III) transport system ATP-binding protein [Austwickia chelonae]|uniref:Spermidine/putrescine import ATP-binding protein PotA n=1 Tax=Austwickia chelonae NBRC 105200 TaxID=1184607 RepID=K6V4P1_9MICO|nr:ABC transporter ATP-binding protein [Austwickia chelonae]GAB77113.1 putative ABC transporter ATP-binding protein [Austwickia chelonae NBRC 105200]SEW03066.1 iron(III) transport system ATP-binding protein [Austwickia chelonae]
MTATAPTTQTVSKGEARTGVIRLSALVKTFPTAAGVFAAVDGVDLRTEPGEFLTLLGPSGCGKTTTLRMIAGFETPTSGEITLDDEDMLRLTPDKRPMSMVFQSYALFPHLSVYDNVAYGLRLKKTNKAVLAEHVEGALTAMDLVRLADRAPHQLSGGQQQRVALARAMVMRPRVLLFDEPLSNLDAKLRVQMRAEIRSLQKRMGITAIYVTHDQDEAMSLSDRIVVMNRGRIEQIGTPEEIYHRPATVFVADFIGQANFFDTETLHLDEGRADVNVLGRARTVSTASRVSPAGTQTLLVRPESIRVEALTSGSESAVEGDRGRVLSSVFYGSTVEYEIESASGTVVAVDSDPDYHGILKPGDLVRITFADDRGWLLQRD